MVTKLHPSRIDNVRFTKSQYEFLAWSIRQIEDTLSYGGDHLRHPGTSDVRYMTDVATRWADELRGTSATFKRDRFISAVVHGEW